MSTISVFLGLGLFATILLFIAASMSVFLRNSVRPDRVVGIQPAARYRSFRRRQM
ncbi:MAG TPA: hypothetical protein VIV14_10945 [Gammaproteobacteria bacterium]